MNSSRDQRVICHPECLFKNTLDWPHVDVEALVELLVGALQDGALVHVAHAVEQHVELGAQLRRQRRDLRRGRHVELQGRDACSRASRFENKNI